MPANGAAGSWSRRQARQTRPTADRTRETLFSMLASRLGSFEGLRVADLYAGSGALGLEALSRGAAHATFVENDRAALKAIEANATALGAGERGVDSGDVGGHPARLPNPSTWCSPIRLMSPGRERRSPLQSPRPAGWRPAAGWRSKPSAGDAVTPPDGWEIAAERDVGRARLTLLRAFRLRPS